MAEKEGDAERGRHERPWIVARARSVPSTTGSVVDTGMLLHAGEGDGGPQVSPCPVFKSVAFLSHWSPIIVSDLLTAGSRPSFQRRLGTWLQGPRCGMTDGGRGVLGGLSRVAGVGGLAELHCVYGIVAVLWARSTPKGAGPTAHHCQL